MNDKIVSFKDLKIWNKGIEIVDDIYKTTKNFPKDELYGLVTQLRRAAVSIPSNIAEGFKRYHNKEYKRFLNISLGSAAELETQLIISRNLKYIGDNHLDDISCELDHLSRMTTLLIKKLN